MQQQPSPTTQHTADDHHWVDLGPTADYPEGEQVCTTAVGKPLVVFNIEGDFHVIANVCPHAGLPLGDGDRRGMVITCPYHGYTYNIKNGRNIDWPHDEPPVKTYPVRIHQEKLQVQMQSPKKDEDTKRGPAPADTPDDEKDACDPTQKPEGAPQDPDCPDGYPDREAPKGRPE
ncbi:Rieske (2Fe-2S) protein [Phycisphaerales bacterium AB-hyl4]|uniref:Rieske (2Fe-2S) protein n=1 Tax=Natronomicrosphaera hydrolytica TaxID=3242702 RepID=A0ABV4U456_9BACT